MNSPKSPNQKIEAGKKTLRWPAPLATAAVARPGGPFRRIVPGMVTGASDVDPALVLTATVAGATYQYSLLWSVLLCVPFLLSVFSVSARIGYETKQGLVDLLRGHYGKNIGFVCAGLVVLINMAMIVADLMAVTDAFSIIMQLPRMFFIAAVAFSVWYILIFRDYRKITHALVLLSLPLFIYVVAAVLAHPDWQQVFSHSIFPQIPRGPGYPTTVVAILGSLLTPYVLVWQTSTRREEAIAGTHSIGGAEHHAGAIVTTVLCYSIMVAAGTVLRIPAGADMTTRMAAEALTPAVGALGTILFALGIIGAGMVALPVLVASMCYSVAEAMGWRSGLNENPWEAVRFYVLISLAMFMASVLNFIKVNPVTALYWSQILAGILTVPILVLILLVSNDRRVMRTTNTWWQNFWIGAATGAIIAAGLIVIWWKLLG
ncbi:MAG TPA: divalent metal cation transporter [Candidatus Angelobacter sp.]|nr:divalent metal cation transporter [Candidatus Angelobacter sp.]